MRRAARLVLAFSCVALLAACAAQGGPKEFGGTLLGAGTGAYVGNQFGRGSGNAAATAIGALVGAGLGAAAGQSLDRADALWQRQGAGAYYPPPPPPPPPGYYSYQLAPRW